MKIINLQDKNYPLMLKEIYDPPKQLYIEGEFAPSDFEKTIAIVGTRDCSSYGKEAAYYFSFNLAKAGMTIVSGLARGIDTVAHKAALEAGGRTLAVLGTGLNEIYPAQNKGLALQVAKSGVVISEFEPDTTAMPYHFPQRNRIVSGLSLGVLLIEAPINSGALITARLALEHNREVFCAPGSIFSKNSAGTNEFIKQGARLVTDFNEILVELGMTTDILESKPVFENEKEEYIYKIISQNSGAIIIDEIIKLSRLSPQEVNSCLTLLELRGIIKNLGTNKYLKI